MRIFGVAISKSPMRIRMRGVAVAGGENPPATRLGQNLGSFNSGDVAESIG